MAAVAPFTSPRETPVEAARRLEEEARAVAKTVADILLTDLVLIAGRCAEASTLQSLPVGVRDLLRQESERIAATVQTAQSIAVRAS